MGDLLKRVPVAALLWVAATLLVLYFSQQTVSLRDEERFVNDFIVRPDEAAPEAEEPNTLVLNVTAGTFEYNVVPETPADVPTGTFTEAGQSGFADPLFDDFEEIQFVIIEQQQMTVGYTSDLEPEQFLRRIQRVINQNTLNEQGTITGEIGEAIEPPEGVDLAAEGEEATEATTVPTLVFTTTDEAFRYGEFVPTLVDEGETETYADREAGLNGSPLAQHLFTDITSIEALTIEPGRLIVTHREGAAQLRLTSDIQDSLNDFYPRASLQPDFWVFSLETSSDSLLAIVPVDTGFPLWMFALAFAGIELLMFFTLRNTEDKLIRPLVRAAMVFLFFWSIYGHEPLWDYLLGQLFPNARQLVHPNGTVIEFTAQHLELVLISSLITIPGGLFFGTLVTRDSFREILPLVNNLVNSGQTIPTIAIVAIMAPIIGFGFWPAIIALVAYGLLPVVRNTIAGLEGVDASIIDSARGMGMTPAQILFQIELPIASAVIMAGVRTSMVINVGTATLGAFVGSGGLGTPIASGLSMSIDPFVVLGAIPAAVLAILVDYILGRIEFVLTPKGLQIES